MLVKVVPDLRGESSNSITDMEICIFVMTVFQAEGSERLF